MTKPEETTITMNPLPTEETPPPVEDLIDAYLKVDHFKTAIYVGFLDEKIMRILQSHFPPPGGISMIPLRGGPMPTVYDTYGEGEGPLPNWLFNELCEGWDIAELLVFNGPLTKTVLRQGIASIGRIAKQIANEAFLDSPRTIVLVGEAAKATGHPSYQWTGCSGFTVGVRIRPRSNKPTAAATS